MLERVAEVRKSVFNDHQEWKAKLAKIALSCVYTKQNLLFQVNAMAVGSYEMFAAIVKVSFLLDTVRKQHYDSNT